MNPSPSPRQLGYRMPAEWERHDATWLAWPKDPLTWPDRIEQAREVFAQIIEALTAHEEVQLLVDDEEAERQVKAKLSGKNIKVRNLRFHRIRTVDSWIRDYGPNFIKLQKPTPKLAYNDWRFNAWGGKYEELKADDEIPRKLAPFLEMPSFSPGIVLEGGSIDVNGGGTVLTTEQCLLNKNRNPHLDKPQIEELLREYLGVSQILWLGDGISGDDTDGHVDDISRFVAADHILTVIEKDPRDENFQPLQDNLKRLKAMRDLNGRPFKISTLPMPNPVHSDEGRLPASYANFYIANGVVLAPIFGHPQDAEALQVLGQIFPERRIVGIRCEDFVFGMGAIHCVTQQQPAVL